MPLFDDLRLKSRDGKFLFGFLIAIIFICFIAWQFSGRNLFEELSSGGPVVTEGEISSADSVITEEESYESLIRDLTILQKKLEFLPTNEQELDEYEMLLDEFVIKSEKALKHLEDEIRALDEEIRKEELRQSI